jgi:hypothetical protein
MNRLDLIIDALRQAYEDTPGWVEKVNEAIYAAQELKALKPVAIRNPINGIIEIQWGASVPLGTKLYALDEVTK